MGWEGAPDGVPAGLSEQARCQARAPRSSKVVPLVFLDVGVASRSLMFLAGIAARGRRWRSCAGCRGQDSASGDVVARGSRLNGVDNCSPAPSTGPRPRMRARKPLPAPSRTGTPGRHLSVRTGSPGYEDRRVTVEFDRRSWWASRVYVDGPSGFDASPHRYPSRGRSELCIWHPDDPPDRTWA